MHTARTLTVLFVLAGVTAAQGTPPKEATKEVPKRTVEPAAPPVAIAATGTAAAATGKGTFVVDAGEIALPALIDRAAACLDCNIVWDPQTFLGPRAAPIRLQKALATDRDGCLEFLAGSLYRAGLALTRADARNGTLEVIDLGGPRGREALARAETRTEEQVLAQPALCMPVTVTVPLKHVNGVIVTNALRPFFAAAGAAPGGSSLTLGSLGVANSLLVSGMQDKVAQAIKMIREVDQPPSPPVENVPIDAGKRIEELERRIKILEDKLADAAKVRK